MKMYFWVGVATVAGALRRRVWFDQKTFRWYPNLYTLLVAPPGVIAKTTTADLGMNLLKAVPGLTFGPDVTTWQALFDAFSDVHEGIMYQGEMLEMSALTVVAGEFGTFLKPDDHEMIDQLVSLWDCRPVRKRTRMDGEQIVANPCLNILGCTTPSWISQSFPDYMIGGGFTSRLLFVYGDAKARYVAYPSQHVPADFYARRDALIDDLERISTLVGPFSITPEAIAYGEAWYEHFHRVESKQIDETLLGGYINRKQTLVHKVAMCLSASQNDELTITKPILERSVQLISELERDMPKVYSRIGMTAGSNEGLRVIAYLDRSAAPASFVELYRYMHRAFPNVTDFQNLIEGLVRAQLIVLAGRQGQDLFFTLPGKLKPQPSIQLEPDPAPD